MMGHYGIWIVPWDGIWVAKRWPVMHVHPVDSIVQRALLLGMSGSGISRMTLRLSVFKHGQQPRRCMVVVRRPMRVRRCWVARGCGRTKRICHGRHETIGGKRWVSVRVGWALKQVGHERHELGRVLLKMPVVKIPSTTAALTTAIDVTCVVSAAFRRLAIRRLDVSLRRVTRCWDVRVSRRCWRDGRDGTVGRHVDVGSTSPTYCDHSECEWACVCGVGVRRRDRMNIQNSSLSFALPMTPGM